MASRCVSQPLLVLSLWGSSGTLHSLQTQRGCNLSWTQGTMLMDSCNKMKKALHSWFCRFGRFGTGWWFVFVFFIFPYIGNNHPNWLSYLSEGLKPPARLDLVYPIIDHHCMPALPWEIGHHFEKGLRLDGFCPKGAVYGDGWQRQWHPQCSFAQVRSL